jgi:hypothetical protein
MQTIADRPDAKPLAREAPVVVHLVHGTWPFGPFRSRSRDKKAWFEEGSEVRNAIEHHVGSHVDFRIFIWSGRNSLSERIKASSALIAHMDLALQENLESRHVIVAHSHGGTIAASCLSRVQIPERPRVKALLCLATPFVYLSTLSRAERNVVSGAIASLLIAAAFLASLFWWDGWFFELNGWWAMVPSHWRPGSHSCERGRGSESKPTRRRLERSVR